MDVLVVSMLSDNYGYIISDRKSKVAAVVDPVEPDKVGLHSEIMRAQLDHCGFRF